MPGDLTHAQLAAFDQSKQASLTGALILILCLANLSVAVRFLAQLRTCRRLFAEDYFIAFAVVWILHMACKELAD